MVDPLVTRWPVHAAAEIEAVTAVLRSGPSGGAKTNYWTGEQGHAFETEWARLIGLPHALTVSNGTTALEACLRGVGLTPEVSAEWSRTGDGAPQVVVPARTFMATASAVVHAGGRPVLADIDAESLCVTAETLEAQRTGATVGVIVVHYAGLPVPDMDNVVRWAMRHGLWIIEDCAHAHGAAVGRASHAAAWSMCVGKIMSTGGEGGMVACLDDGVAGRMRAYRDHGRYQMNGKRPDGASASGAFAWTVSEFGSNLRMTEMQSALGRVQLRGLAAQVARRREIAAAYDDAFGWNVSKPGHVHYMYIGQVDNRDAVMKALNEDGIPARISGCPNIGYEAAFTKRGWSSPCPVADAVGERTLGLPCYPTMTDAEVARVCDAVRRVMRGRGAGGGAGRNDGAVAVMGWR